MLLFDVEGDGFLEELTRAWCIVAYDRKTQTWHEWRPDQIDEAFAFIDAYDGTVMAHNAYGYDGPAIAKLGGPVLRYPKLHDSLVLARVAYSSIESVMVEQEDGKLKGEVHSIEAWGRRLDLPKGEHKEFSEWSPEMLAYCRRDVEIIKALVEKIERDEPWALNERCYEIEQEFAQNIQDMMFRGVLYDRDKADALVGETQARLAEIDAEILAEFPGWEIHYVTPKKNIAKTKFKPFNPGSRQQVAQFLMERYDWEPDKYTPSGQAEISETVLEDAGLPIADMLAERFRLIKLLGSLQEGPTSWSKSLDPTTSRIHGYVNHAGAVTSRCTHSGPNTANIPRKGWWLKCRELFTASDGCVLVGADASRLELVGLAHYLAHWDAGAYIDVVSVGDPHERNRVAAGLETRDQAKTFIYAMNYGAGDFKIGSITKPTPEALDEVRQTYSAQCSKAVERFRKRNDKEPSADYGPLSVIGSHLRRRFMSNLAGFGSLVEACQERAPYFTKFDKRTGYARKEKGPGWIPLLDGRRIVVRHPHAALNSLLQAFGAIVMKVATNLACERIQKYGAALVLHVHDEMQCESPEDHAETVGQILSDSITEAALVLGVRCPLGAEYKIGKTWRDTH